MMIHCCETLQQRAILKIYDFWPGVGNTNWLHDNRVHFVLGSTNKLRKRLNTVQCTCGNLTTVYKTQPTATHLNRYLTHKNRQIEKYLLLNWRKPRNISYQKMKEFECVYVTETLIKRRANVKYNTNSVTTARPLTIVLHFFYQMTTVSWWWQW